MAEKTGKGGARGKEAEKTKPKMAEKVVEGLEGLEGISEAELIARIKEFLRKKYYKKLLNASSKETAVVVKYGDLDKFSPELGDMLRIEPDRFLSVASKAIETIDLPNPVKMRVSHFPDMTHIRDLRAKHLGKFICIEGIVRRASEIRPEIMETVWECPECGERITQLRKGSFVSRPFECGNCGNRRGFKQTAKNMIDARWITLEEPFELVEGERPSQLNLVLAEDLTSPDHRRMTEPGSRLKASGILREIPKGKTYDVKLDFFMDTNHIEPTEVGWERLVLTKKDEEEILKMSKDPNIYRKLTASLAPSLYGMNEIKESIILQLFSGVPRTMRDKTTFRGEIHLLLIGDPASGKTQLMKLVPQIVPRSKYVSGKGTTTAGLTASVIKDEQFMGGWVLEAGAMVLANKGLLSVDEFEKMDPNDQVAMHEALESGTVSIAKASIVATLPAKTSVLAGGNPKFSRFDDYQSISKQITIADTLLSRFDLKFILRDVPNAEQDRKVVDHILKTREGNYEPAIPKIEPDFIKKYVSYAKLNCKPILTKESGRVLRNFYLRTRKKAEAEGAPIPITLRQFEALMRLSEASAKIQLSPEVRMEDAKRAIRLMQYSLRQLGMTESGEIDIDKSEGLISSSERGKIRIVMEIIAELSKTKKQIARGEIEEEARKQGIEKDNVDEILDKLKTDGTLFEPSPGYLERV